MANEPILRWQLTKDSDEVETYDGLVGERLLMVGSYDRKKDAPGTFHPYEVGERIVQKVMLKLGIQHARKFNSNRCQLLPGTHYDYKGAPGLRAPRPRRRRGTLNLRYNDNHGHLSSTLSIFYPGTASSKFDPEITVGHDGITLGVVEITRGVEVRPVRHDPTVTVRVISGDELSEYIRSYLRDEIRSYLRESRDLQAERPSPRQLADAISDLQRQIARGPLLEAYLRDTIVDLNMQPGESAITTLAVQLRPTGDPAMLALQTETENGSVVSDICEISANTDGSVAWQ